MAAKRVYDIDYRKEETDFILRRWRSGTSVCVIGVGSAGKSNLLHHLIDPTTRARVLKDNASNIIPVVVDLNMLGPLAPSEADKGLQMRCWSAYELMLHQLYLTLYPFNGFDQVTIERITEAYHALHDGRNPLLGYMALRYVELALETVIQSGISLVFIFDEFDEMLRQIPNEFFRALRALRDAHKRCISYTIFVRVPLVSLVHRHGLSRADLEPFNELFTDNLLFLGPFSSADAKRFLNDLNVRAGSPLSTDVLDAIYDLSGGHAGLMRASFGELRSSAVNVDASLLITRPAPYAEAETIWKGLAASEQRVLKAVSRLATYTITEETKQAVQMLIRRRLVKLERSSQTLTVQPPLFSEYLRTDPDFT